MTSLKVAESKAMHQKIIEGVRLIPKIYHLCRFLDFQGSLDAIQSPEEASGLLTKAMEHERWSCMYKEFTAFQLEKAQEDVNSAEDQLKSAEEYMCSIMDAIRCLGFAVEFIDSDTAAVVKILDSMLPKKNSQQLH